MMRRPKVLWISGLLLLVATACWLLMHFSKRPDSKPATITPAPVVTNPQPQPAVAPQQVDTGLENEAASDVQRITRVLRDYRTIAGDNPIGSNAEIVQALSGDNIKQAKILPPDMPLNGNGELVDRWGTPYFFHQLSRTSMEIRSAGSDRRMWTSDDVFTR
ncbi:type II secretion system protein GspG [Prosthecobacter vanneervenii]|uniref:Type II secretion system protein GspG C-terminal domain-containing protein n=1 Tax=Prosthecobacter vanneervenii TaxID=48466 RepID=A0A7W7YA20_9BACT|nr:type II secretion system protein GspG [Prosthecobacter vanneervenii]MBB5032187.1 hypothetical protein [Prosthecobacter vanneervenii]